MRGVRAGCTFLAFSVWMVACDRTIVGPDHAAPLSTNTLIAALQAHGASVMRGPSLPRESHPYFSVNGQVLVVNNGDVTVFEYPSTAAWDKDVAQVSPSGTPIGNVQISWVGPPTFFKGGILIVLYVGSDDAVLRPLKAVLGAPFAHR
jgi:hypothetical protein